jgi:hypothetical protein
MLQELLNEHAHDPKDPNKIYNLARQYDIEEQGAMAISLYLKAADLTFDEELQYRCMLRIALVYNRQGNRRYTVEGALLDALGLGPERPEVHHHLSNYYAEVGAWKQAYYHAHAGVMCSESYDHYEELEFGGIEHVLVQRAIAKWHITGQQDAKRMLFDLKFRQGLKDPELYQQVSDKLDYILYPDTIYYKEEDFERFKWYFPGLEDIKKNYSKHYQDLFVLSLYQGKRDGTYFEIGAGDPFVHSNTALLEKEFGWKGISIDNNPGLCYNFKQNRRNPVICADATTIGFNDLFDKHCVDPIVDYLQIDCDDATHDILKNIPFDRYKFGVITLEHDCYRLGTETRDEMRELLREQGYVLLVGNVAFTEIFPYEDWFVHPDVVDIYNHMKGKSGLNFVWDYFMNEIEV